MSTHTTPRCPDLVGLIEKTVIKQSDCFKIKSNLKNILQELNFIKKGLRLQISDPSYKLRYLHAFNFWIEKSGNNVIEIVQAKELIKALREELNSKDCVYPEYADESIKIPDGFFSGEYMAVRKRNSADSRDKPVWYVSSKCEGKLYAKSANIYEAEKEIILPIYLTPLKDDCTAAVCSDKLICPGDEVQVIPSLFGDTQSIHILKYVY